MVFQTVSFVRKEESLEVSVLLQGILLLSVNNYPCFCCRHMSYVLVLSQISLICETVFQYS